MTGRACVISVTGVNDEPTLSFSDADLELLLAEADREDPILRDGRVDRCYVVHFTLRSLHDAHSRTASREPKKPRGRTSSTASMTA